MEVIPTRNFERNLDDIAVFLAGRGEPGWFERLLDRLFDEVIPNLEAFPHMGRDFLTRTPASAEGHFLHGKIVSGIGDTVVREYLFDQYLLLYAEQKGDLYLLSIKHQAQLSFDLASHWR